MERKEYIKEYKRKNKEKIALSRRIYEKKWRQRPDIKLKKKAYMKEYRTREISKENKRKQDKKYADFHREKINRNHRIWREENKEKLLPKYKIYNKNNYYKHREKIIVQQKVFNEAYPLIYKARIEARKIPHKENCEHCGSTKFLQKHHKDYDKPLEVITLCSNCHAKTKKNYKGTPLLLN